MGNEKEYSIPEIIEDELKVRKDLKNKRRVVGVGTGLSCAAILLVVSAIGLHVDEITNTPVMNNLINFAYGVAGTVSVLSLKNDIDLLIEFNAKLKEKNKKMREKIRKYFAKEEEIKTQEILENTENNKDYEQFIAILQTHNDLLEQKMECLKYYKVQEDYDEELYNRDSAAVQDLQRQYRFHEINLLIDNIKQTLARNKGN